MLGWKDKYQHKLQISERQERALIIDISAPLRHEKRYPDYVAGLPNGFIVQVVDCER